MAKTLVLLMTNETDAVFQMTRDGGLNIFSGGMEEFLAKGSVFLIKDIEWTYEVSDAQKAAYSGRSFILRLTLRNDEYEVFQTASTLPASGRVAGQHYLSQGIGIAKGPRVQMKMWFGGGDSGLDKGYLRVVMRGTLIKG